MEHFKKYLKHLKHCHFSSQRLLRTLFKGSLLMTETLWEENTNYFLFKEKYILGVFIITWFIRKLLGGFFILSSPFNFLPTRLYSTLHIYIWNFSPEVHLVPGSEIGSGRMLPSSQSKRDYPSCKAT